MAIVLRLFIERSEGKEPGAGRNRSRRRPRPRFYGLIRSFVSPVTIGVLPHLRRPSTRSRGRRRRGYLDATRLLASDSGSWLLVRMSRSSSPPTFQPPTTKEIDRNLKRCKLKIGIPS
jgi:hypothetical protein